MVNRRGFCMRYLNEINNEARGEEEQAQWHNDSCCYNSHPHSLSLSLYRDSQKERKKEPTTRTQIYIVVLSHTHKQDLQIIRFDLRMKTMIN